MAEVRKVHRTGEQVTVGRHDYGHGHTAEVVTVGEEAFATHHGRFYTACGYCSPQWSGTKTYHMGVAGGVCFQCAGRGTTGKAIEGEDNLLRVANRRIKDRARREAKRIEQVAAAEAAAAEQVAAFRAAHPEVAAALAEVYAEIPDNTPGSDVDPDAYYTGLYAAEEKWGTFVVEMAGHAEQRGLTDKQAAAVMAEVERRKAWAAEKAAKVAESRHYGTEGQKVVAAPGVVSVAINIESMYGTARMVVIEGTGDYAGVTFKVFGSGATLWETGKGDEVEVTATIKAHEEYDGVAQTALTRAKVKVTKPAEEE